MIVLLHMTCLYNYMYVSVVQPILFLDCADFFYTFDMRKGPRNYEKSFEIVCLCLITLRYTYAVNILLRLNY